MGTKRPKGRGFNMGHFCLCARIRPLPSLFGKATVLLRGRRRDLPIGAFSQLRSFFRRHFRVDLVFRLPIAGCSPAKDTSHSEEKGGTMAKRHERPSLQYRYEHYDPR